MAVDPKTGEWVHVVLDKSGREIAIGEKVALNGKPAVVRQIIINHPAPPKEFMQHATYSVLIALDGGDERRVEAVDVEKA